MTHMFCRPFVYIDIFLMQLLVHWVKRDFIVLSFILGLTTWEWGVAWVAYSICNFRRILLSFYQVICSDNPNLQQLCKSLILLDLWESYGMKCQILLKTWNVVRNIGITIGDGTRRSVAELYFQDLWRFCIQNNWICIYCLTGRWLMPSSFSYTILYYKISNLFLLCFSN